MVDLPVAQIVGIGIMYLTVVVGYANILNGRKYITDHLLLAQAPLQV